MNWLRREGTGRYLNEAGLTGFGRVIGTPTEPFRRALQVTWRGHLQDSDSDHLLDFVYLADDRLTVASLAEWAERVKPGGLIAGSGYAGAVKERVDAVFRASGRAVASTANDPDPPDWFVRRPLGPPPTPDRITVVTAFDAGYATTGAISRPNKEAYCQRQGYRFVCRTEGFDTDRPISWSKLRFVREALADADWVFWTDADSLVMNGDVPLSHFCWDCHDLVLSGDPYHGMNLGAWFARRSDWTFDFLERVESMRECTDHVWWENGAILSRYAGNPAVRGRIGLLPNALFNAYPYPGGGYTAGAFLVHCPGMDRARRDEVLQEFAARAASLS